MSLLLRGRGRRGRRTSVVAFAGALMAFQALALIGALPASAASCGFSGGVLTVTSTGLEASLFSRDAAGAITVSSCAAGTGGATVATTTAISLTGDTGDQDVTIDLDDGGWGTINWTLAVDGVPPPPPPPGVPAVQTLVITDTSAAVTDDTIVLGASGIDLNGDGDLDVTHSGFSVFTVTSAAGADSLSANGSTATGAAFASAVTLDGGAGDDTILGGAGGDTLIGGAGTDTLDCSTTSGGAVFTLPGGVAGDKCGVGTDTWAGFESLIGTSVKDTLTGDGLANTFTPGAGDDTVTGAAGIDTLDLSDAAAGVTVDSKAGKTSGGSGVDTFTTIETIVGSDFVDTLDFSGETGPVTATLGTTTGLPATCPAAGVVTGSSSFATATDFEDAKGSAKGDTLCGSAGRNMLEGGDGDDILGGGGGNDTILGGKGNNVLSGGDGFDFTSYATASGGVTVDLSAGFATHPDGDDTISGFENVDGSTFADTLRGDASNNTLRGLSGADNIKAGAGDDTVLGGGGADLIRGGADDDDLFGRAGNDQLFGGGGTDLGNGGKGKRDRCRGIEIRRSCEL